MRRYVAPVRLPEGRSLLDLRHIGRTLVTGTTSFISSVCERFGPLRSRAAKTNPELALPQNTTAPMNAMAPSQNSRLLASAAKETVTLCDAACRRALRTLGGHREPTAVALAPDGEVLAAAACIGAIRVWDVCSGALTRTLRQTLSRGGRCGEVVPIERVSDGEVRSTDKAAVQAVFVRLAEKPVAAVPGQVPDADHIATARPDDLVIVSFAGHGHADEQWKAGRLQKCW
jgi:WD40 repeat protein